MNIPLSPWYRWCLLLIATPAIWSAEPRRSETFDFGWRFFKGDAPGAEPPAFVDDAWRKLDLPHDWSIEGPYDQKAATAGSGGFLPAGVGWYRKHFQVPANGRGRKVTIQFDGVYMNSDVWINGVHLGRRPYGYVSFSYDVTRHLVSGVNVVGFSSASKRTSSVIARNPFGG